MEIILDGEARALPAPPQTVGSALIEINADLQADGRALQQVIVDGRVMPAEELTPAFGQTPSSDVQRLELTSARIVDLVRESLTEVEAVLAELPVACQTLAGILNSDEAAEGRESFEQLLAIWEALAERERQVARALGLDLEALSIDGRSLSTRDMELQSLLVKARGAMADGETASVADLLAYDLSALADQEADVIALLHAQCHEDQ